VRAFQLAQTHIDAIAGEAFNIGGGPGNAISLLEVLDLIEQLNGQPLTLDFAEWRPGDQRYYVSDTAKFAAATKWQPQVSVRAGLQRLYRWLQDTNGSPQANATPLQSGRVLSQQSATPQESEPAYVN
jgi:CDP-paratose 2-epimerase